MTHPFKRTSAHRPSEENASKEKRKVEYNPRGLNVLYPGVVPQVDFVFVHGLRGGSVKTWCHDDDLDLFWPKEWISIDEELRDRVRTSSYGYAGDWLDAKSSKLTLHDFGRDLVHHLDNSPFLNKSPNAPIILIGHSMGGLVIKKACLLAQQQRKQIARRIKAIVFLATPHRGSAMAEHLDGVLGLVRWQHAFVKDLRPNSGALQVLNDEFRMAASEMKLRLCSFYETKTMTLGVTVVKQDSALLGYDIEDGNMLFANHRSVCKFPNPQDETYLTIRNTLLRLTDDLIAESRKESSREMAEQMTSIASYLNISHPPQLDLDQQYDKKTDKTCEWLEQRETFQEWIEGSAHISRPASTPPGSHTLLESSTLPPLGRCRIYWLTGNLGAGKSVCTAHVITSLHSQQRDCVYHFFQSREKAKTRVSAMLLSLAFQMAEMHSNIRRAIVGLQDARIIFDEDDDSAIWRKLFVNCILKVNISQPQYWIIDAIDECTAVEKFFDKLQNLESSFDIRIFITSQHKSKLKCLFGDLDGKIPVTRDAIQPDDTHHDMSLYMRSRLGRLPIDDPVKRNEMVQNLPCKANNCFLWLKLVSQELEQAYSEDSIAEILEEIPLEMSDLYERSVQTLRGLKRLADRRTAEAVLVWVGFAMQPLTLAGLKTALTEYDGCKVTNLKAMVEGLCSGLLFVDSNDYVRFVHATAHDYLVDALKSSFDVSQEAANERLAKACIECLMKELALTRSHPLGSGESGKNRNYSEFASYASCQFSEHFTASSPQSQSLLHNVSTLMSERAFAWIEYVAREHPSLYPLTRAAKNFKDILRQRQVKHETPLESDFSIVNAWSTDLIRLVAKFGQHLRSSPASIHDLIPSVAPRRSQLFLAVQHRRSRLELVGQASEDWDDCICAIHYKGGFPASLATGENVFGFALMNGTILVYDQSTCQKRLSVQHISTTETCSAQSKSQAPPRIRVRLLTFDSSDTNFASASEESICVWAIDGKLLQMIPLQEPCVTIKFSMHGRELIGVARSSRITRWPMLPEDDRRASIADPNLMAPILPRQPLVAAAVSPDFSMMALLYKGRRIYLYSLETDMVLGCFGRDPLASYPSISAHTAIFNPIPELTLLAAADEFGGLAVYDVIAKKVLARDDDAQAWSIAVTPDGQTLGSGNARGTINLRDFETLSLLYSITSSYDWISSLSFSGDGLRIVDIRESRTKVWEPSALVRRPRDENVRKSEAMGLDAPVFGANEEVISITVMCADEMGNFIFAGREDGSVAAYEVSTGVIRSQMYSHAPGKYVFRIAFQSGIIASASLGGSVIVRSLESQTGPSTGGSQLLKLDPPGPVQKLLFSDDGARLLVATTKNDAIWDIHTRRQLVEFEHQTIQLQPKRQWVRLGQRLAAVADCSLEVYDWDSLQQVSSLSLPLLPCDSRLLQSSTNIKIVREVLLQDSNYDGVACRLSSTDPSVISIAGWTVTSPQVTSESQKALGFFLDLPSEAVLLFIGIYNDCAIFVSGEMWVCSVKLCSPENGTAPNIQRHFFIPSDFLRGESECRPIVTAHGDIVFAKEGEISIVKGGLS